MTKIKRNRNEYKSNDYLEYMLYALKNYEVLRHKNGIFTLCSASEQIADIESELDRRRLVRADRERVRLEKEAMEGSATNRRRI